MASTAFTRWSQAWASRYGVQLAWDWTPRANLVVATTEDEFFIAFTHTKNALALFWLDDASTHALPPFASCITVWPREKVSFCG